eukprot:14787411-Alexandrium_andersonii.AAC.1
MVYKDLVRPDFWKDMCERPVATALQFLPRDEILVVESEWHDVVESGKKMAMSGHIRVAESSGPHFEGLSGVG